MRSATAFLIGGVTIMVLVAMANAVVFHGAVPGHTPVSLTLLLLLMQGLAAVVGGYAAARIARGHPVAHGLGAGVLYLIALQFTPGSMAVFTQSLASRALWVACTALGLTLVGSVLGGAVRRTKG